MVTVVCTLSIPYPYVYAQQIRLTAFLIIRVCMLFDARDILLPKRYKLCFYIFYIADNMMSSPRNYKVLESKNVCV